MGRNNENSGEGISAASLVNACWLAACCPMLQTIGIGSARPPDVLE
jgi:hypothetical protein